MAERPSNRQRVAEIKKNLKQHYARMPNGWSGWSADRVAGFKRDLRDSGAAGSLDKITPPAQRIATAYGVPWATIDPGEQP